MTQNNSQNRTDEAYHENGKPVVAAQLDLQKVGVYTGCKVDGWYGDKMKDSVTQFQEAASKGTFTVNGVDTVFEEKLVGYKKWQWDVPTQDYMKMVLDKGGKVPADTNAITGSVGLGGVNKPADLKIVRQKLKALGYPVKDEGEAITPDDIKAIKFFQIFNASSFHLGVLDIDGRIDAGGKTEKALFGNAAKKYEAPSKGEIKLLKDTIETAKKKDEASTSEEAKAGWRVVMDAWKILSPYLPEGTIMTSGYRSKEKQRTELYERFKDAKLLDKYVSEFKSAGEKDPRSTYNDCIAKIDNKAKETEDTLSTIDKKIHKPVEKYTGDIALPGKSAHERGKAVDIAYNAARARFAL